MHIRVRHGLRHAPDDHILRIHRRIDLVKQVGQDPRFPVIRVICAVLKIQLLQNAFARNKARCVVRFIDLLLQICVFG